MFCKLSSVMKVPNSKNVGAGIKPICSVANLLERCYIWLLFWEVSLLRTVRDQHILRLECPEKSDLRLKLALLGAQGWVRWPPEVPSSLNYSMILWKVLRSIQGCYPVKPPSGLLLFLDCMGHTENISLFHTKSVRWRENSYSMCANQIL